MSTATWNRSSRRSALRRRACSGEDAAGLLFQFTKAREVAEGMGIGDLEKHERALEELRLKGLAPD